MFEISVIITTIPKYNKFLKRAISSVDLPFTDSEIIVVNDSLKPIRSDGTIKVINRTGKERLGAGGARNLGVENSSFDLILFLDADDFLLPGALSQLRRKYIEILQETGEEHIIYGGLVKGDKNEPFHFQDQYRGRKLELTPIYRHNMPYLCLIPKKHFLSVGGFDKEEDVPTHEELVLEAKFWAAGIKATRIPTLTYYYTWHNEGSRRSLGYNKEIYEKVQLYKKELFKNVTKNPFKKDEKMACGTCGGNVPLTKAVQTTSRKLPVDSLAQYEEMYLVYTGAFPTETYTSTMTVTGTVYKFGESSRLKKKKVVNKPPEQIDPSTEIHIDDAKALYMIRRRNFDDFTYEIVFTQSTENPPVEIPVTSQNNQEIVTPEPEIASMPVERELSLENMTVSEIKKVDFTNYTSDQIQMLISQETNGKNRKSVLNVLTNVSS